LNISINWLKDYIDLSGITVEDIVDKITTAGLEVDEVIDESKKFDKIVVGLVKEKYKHPNADKLSVCKVDDGKEIYNVVCGAPNVEAGQKIAFAKVGAVIPSENFKLTKAKIRGEVSLGMICSEKELTLGEDHNGILVLDTDAKIGTPLSKVFGLDDVLLDIAITPNRADALSHIGVARDVSALFERDIQMPNIVINESDTNASRLASIEIENTIDCPRYVAKVVENVEIKESPKWLKAKLESIGLRPINNVVDVTNFVLYEVGQPLHAFDLDKLSGKKIIVKSAKEGDKFVTLDSKERTLLSSDLMICDAEKPVAIAGVMGGENSEVSELTKNILIESAYFRPSSIRKTSKKLGLQTDASYRFERGCNPDITVFAAQRAAQLIAELGNGKVAKGEIDVYPNSIEEKIVNLRFARITKILGFDVPKETVKNTFLKLGFSIVSSNETELSIEVPLFRPDIEREIDLIEEVARIYGFDQIPPVKKISVSLSPKVDQYSFTDKLRGIFSGFGFNEIITNSLWNKQTAEKFGNSIGVLNPVTVEMSHLRPSLLPGILSTISKNIKVKENSLSIYEIGHIFNKKNDEIVSFKDFEEKETILFAITGNYQSSEWYQNQRKYDIFDLKGVLSGFYYALYKSELKEKNFVITTKKGFNFYFDIKIGNKILGSGGEVSSDVLKYFDIHQPVFAFEFDILQLNDVSTKQRKYKQLLKYPKVKRDFAFVLDKNINVGSVVKYINSVSSNLLKNVKLFDIFEGDSLGANKKSIAFELEYFEYSKTLTDEEVDKDFWKVIESVKNKFNAELRGYLCWILLKNIIHLWKNLTIWKSKFMYLYKTLMN